MMKIRKVMLIRASNPQMAASSTARPIQTLRDHVTSLEAAITFCFAEPQPKPVHRLRTTTRRIEAQLTLLSLLPKLPPHRKPGEKAQRLLKKLRRAAGEVRDLDVQRDLIKEKSSTETKKDSTQLRKTLKQRRGKAEANLIDVLKQHQSKLVLSLESLLDALEPAESLTLASIELSRLTQDWFARNLPAQSDDPDDLHAIRKIAKLARYIAESAPESDRTTRKLAVEYEDLQHAGGEWHDWLILSGIANDELGKSSILAQTFQRECQKSLTAYRKRLQPTNL